MSFHDSYESDSESFTEMENSTDWSNLTDSTGNSTTEEPVPLEFLKMSVNSRNCVIAYIFLFIIAATGNFSVFFSVLHQILRRTKSRISVFILHLSLADLLVTFGVIPLEVSWRITIQWYGGNGLCKFCKFFSAFGLYLSSFVLICISLDRYSVIIHPLRVTDARRRGKSMLLAAWIMATICSLPQVFIFRVVSHPKYPSFKQCVSLGAFNKPGEELLYNVFSVGFMYFLPLLVVIFTYVMIICKIDRKSRQHTQSQNGGESSGRFLLRRSDASNHMERARNRTLKLFVVLLSVFVLCLTPYVVMTLWYMVDRPSAEKVDPRIQDGLFLMVVSNSCLNPLVYGAFTRECRDSMRNCCGFYNGSRREGPGRRNQFGRRPGPGDLRRQSQLKILNTSAKRPTMTGQAGHQGSSGVTSLPTLNDVKSQHSHVTRQAHLVRDQNGIQRFRSPITTRMKNGNESKIQSPDHPLSRSASLNPHILGSSSPPSLPVNAIREGTTSNVHFRKSNEENGIVSEFPTPEMRNETGKKAQYRISITPTTVICKIENSTLNPEAVV